MMTTMMMRGQLVPLTHSISSARNWYLQHSGHTCAWIGSWIRWLFSYRLPLTVSSLLCRSCNCSAVCFINTHSHSLDVLLLKKQLSQKDGEKNNNLSCITCACAASTLFCLHSQVMHSQHSLCVSDKLPCNNWCVIGEESQTHTLQLSHICIHCALMTRWRFCETQRETFTCSISWQMTQLTFKWTIERDFTALSTITHILHWYKYPWGSRSQTPGDCTFPLLHHPRVTVCSHV